MTRAASTRHPLLAALLSAAAVALVAAGCASETAGQGAAREAAPPTSAASGAPIATAPVSAPVSSPPPSTTSVSSAPTSGSGATAGAAACAAADYCDDFSDPSSGWSEANEPNYFAGYDNYLGGTYRTGERTAAAKIEVAPFDATTITDDYGVRVEADVTAGRRSPASSYVGLACWQHTTNSGAQAGFVFFVTAKSADVTLLGDAGGTPHTLERVARPPLHPAPATNHVAVTCIQGAGGLAQLALEINGEQVLSATYEDSVQTYAWSPGGHAGVLVAGAGSDVFWDNFAITAV